MDNRITAGIMVRHFKNNVYKVENIVEHVDGGAVVIYKDMKSGKLWARDYDEFVSEVDKDKYPKITQRYRFEVL